jgi:N-sulfoglucosamine sulfohydrolase
VETVENSMVKKRYTLLAGWVVLTASLSLLAGCAGLPPGVAPTERPNILIIISDDQSWLHLGVAGDPVVKTPSIDRLARDGVLFTHAFSPAPSCSPSRAAILTGQQIWRLGPAANQEGPLDAKYAVYPDLLGLSGYFVGFTGKGWAPGNVEATGRSRNPAGDEFNTLGDRNMAGNFETFLDSVPRGTPFCFWMGSRYPHRPFASDPAEIHDIDIGKIVIPPLWPENDRVRGDIAAYLRDIERFDDEVGAAIDLLDARGQLDNTLIVVTSDNGMPFPRAKANLYDLGTRVPLVVYWKGHVLGGRVVDDMVSLTDLAPTFLEAAGKKPPSTMTGSSLMDILEAATSGRVDPDRDFVVTARERHAASRKDLLGYPSRALRTHGYLYIRNYAPDRWPAGDPPVYGDVDSWNSTYSAPTKDYIVAFKDNPYVHPFFELCFGKRPAEELYDVRQDPYEINDLLVRRDGSSSASPADYEAVRKQLAERLDKYLRKTGDPRAAGQPAPWDGYPMTDRLPEPGAGSGERE